MWRATWNPTIIENPLMVEDGEPYEVKRKWKERLFSLPWRPLQATRTVVPKVPMRNVYMFGSAIFAHPVTAEELRKKAVTNMETA